MVAQLMPAIAQFRCVTREVDCCPSDVLYLRVSKSCLPDSQAIEPLLSLFHYFDVVVIALPLFVEVAQLLVQQPT